MNDMTKQQLVLLVLLVSFVTALVTGIVTVTLVNQAPPPVTQTIQKIIERSVGVIPEPLPKDERKELESAALARDVLIGDIVSRASPAVLSVVATKDIPVIEQYFVDPFGGDEFLKQFFPDLRVPQYRQKGTEKLKVSSGSGFFVSPDGYLVTNKHVVEDQDAEYSIVTNDKKTLKAKVIARDPLNDLAVLKVEGNNFTFVKLGNSDDVKIGHTVIAIGNALGEFANSVSVGIVSGLMRDIIASGAKSGPEALTEVMQTDAAINPGNSGGPLLNLKSEAIALNVAMAQGAENIGFALPINQIKRGLGEAKEKGKITYPLLGVRYTLVTPEIKEKQKLAVDYGALVLKGQNGEAAVVLGSPADKAGIKEKNIILEFGGVKITKNTPLAKLIQNNKVGNKVKLKILRDGKESTLELTLEERKSF